MRNKCPTCKSTAPHMHPAVQFEGEVEICIDDFHLTPTNQNDLKYIAAVMSKKANNLMTTKPETTPQSDMTDAAVTTQLSGADRGGISKTAKPPLTRCVTAHPPSAR